MEKIESNSGRTFAFILVLLLFLGGCDSGTEPSDQVARILVANQGNFSDGNGSVTSYDVDSGSTLSLASGLASIIQSIYEHNGKLYVMSNTADRIDVYDLATNTRTGQITGVVSPRYMLAVSETKAYVTNLYKQNFAGGTVSVIDLATNTVTSTIDVGSNPEGLALVGPSLFVANWGFGAGKTVSVISTTSDTLVSTVDVGCFGPRSIHVGALAEVGVVCSGQTVYNADFTQVIERIPGAVTILDGADLTLQGTTVLPSQLSTAGPGQQTSYDPTSGMIYVASDDNRLIKYNLGTATIVGSIGPITGDPIGAIAWSVADERLYLGRVPSFVEEGKVTVHGEDGGEQLEFTVGIAPTHILFLQD